MQNSDCKMPNIMHFVKFQLSEISQNLLWKCLINDGDTKWTKTFLSE